MSSYIQELPVDDSLRLVLFGLECALDVEFNVSVVEQIFADAAQSKSNIRYTLCDVPRTLVTGHAGDYEPGTLWLTVSSYRNCSPALPVIVERAQYQMLRWNKWRDAQQSADISDDTSPQDDG